MISKRLQNIDQMRGLVMLLMLLDHVRERFFLHVQISDPLDLQQTDSGLAWTRLLAHLCAPTFVFLTGVSAWLYGQKHSQAQLRLFLFKRGLVLLALEVTLVNFSWFGSYQTLYLQVIWIFGWCMLVLALLISLPRTMLWVFAITLIAGHNLLTPIQFSANEWGYTLWTILHDRGYLLPPNDKLFAIKLSYPLLPWLGVIVLGFLAGTLFQQASAQRQRILFSMGISSFLLLLTLRSSNIYGETQPWLGFDCPNAVSFDCIQQSLLAFFNFTKYPPSLDFLLLTLGVMALLLTFFERMASKAWFQPLGSMLADFGAAPMFFYLLHLYVLLGIYSVAVAVYGTNKGQWFGVDHLWQIWLVAGLLAVVLYPPTRWFAAYKQQSKAAWVRYL